MRIISGKLKGKKINIPKDNFTRPLRDLVKESIFNVIDYSNKFNTNIKNGQILDLFSGTGSFGLEAASREAKNIIFVENHIPAIQILKKNIQKLDCENICNIIENNCFSYLNSLDHDIIKFDIVFLDPPYKEKKINDLLNEILRKKILKEDGIIIIHRHKKDTVELTQNLNVIDVRSYGISKIIFGK